MKYEEIIECRFSTMKDKELHFHQEPEIIYLLDGELTVSRENVSHQLKKDDFLVVNSNVRHEWHGSGDLLIGSIFVNYNLLTEMFNGQQIYFLCDSTKEKSEEYEKMRYYIRQIFNYYQTMEGQAVLLRRSISYQMLYLLTSVFIVKKGMSHYDSLRGINDERMNEILNYILAHYQEQITLQELADKLYLSNAYLSKYIKRNFGLSFLKLVNNIRNEELINDPEVQVVLIAANNNQHHDLVIRAARAGKDIICEKPVAMSLEELDDMVKVTQECGVKFTVHHQRRFDPDFRTAKAVFDSKTLGDVFTVKSSLYGFNGNMHDWHVYVAEGGGMLYDWGVHLLDQMLWMMPGAKIKSLYADIRNVINVEVDDYFKILMRFDNNITAEVELGTYYLTDKMHDKWFERHWFIGGNKGSAYVDGFEPEGKIVRTAGLLQNVGGKRTMTAAGPTRSFGPPPEGKILTEELPKVDTCHENYFENYIRAYYGEEEFLVKIPETRRVLALMNAVRESGRTGRSIDFE